MEKDMEKGQIFNIEIEDMSSEGQGIGRAEGLVVFVPGVVVGDRAKVELTKVKKNYAFSKLLEITKASESRNDIFDCAFFDKGCGGCPYGKLSYQAQLRLKERQVKEKLRRLGEIDTPVVRSIIGMDDDDNGGFGCYRYRNKASFPVSTGGIITRKGGIVENLGQPAVGFFRAKSHEVVDCEDCYLQSMAAMAAADALRRFMEEDNITAWDPKWEKGLLRHLIVKTAFSTGEVMVILVINGKGIPNISKLIEMLDDAIYEAGYSLESVVLNIKRSVLDKSESNGKKAKRRKKSGHDLGRDIDKNEMIFRSGEIMGDENIIVAGKPVIVDRIGGLKFEISPSSFYQVNPVQVKRLYDKVREYCGFFPVGDRSCAEGENKSVILDIYCGVGTIGLYCADEADAVVGIESVKEAVINANRNAVINNIVNARYICGKAEDILPQYINVNSDDGDEESFSNECKTAGKKGTTYEKNETHEIDEEIAEMIKNAEIAILDPPRSGCKPELLEAVAVAGVARIVYVSCDPATLARDIRLLRQMGYEFVEATPVDMFPHTAAVEVVCLLSKLRAKHSIEVELEMSEMDLTAAESKATYEEIKDYVLEHSGLKVSSLYIAQVKQKCGIIERINYNQPKSENFRQPKCPPEKEKVIREALEHFRMI